jgi:hypothetical protein
VCLPRVPLKGFGDLDRPPKLRLGFGAGFGTQRRIARQVDED